jgi:hypothetical protein
VSGDELVLRNTSETAQFTTPGGRSGMYPISYFSNTSVGSVFIAADGNWLSAPQAALYGVSAPGTQSVVLLTLRDPKYDAATEVHIVTEHLFAPRG